MRIQDGALVVDLGGGRTVSVARAGRPRLRRLVILGRGGWWSFEVPHWLAAVGAQWVFLARDGTPLGSGPDAITPDNPLLRAAQATAPLSAIGLSICRTLIVDKLAAQRRLLSERLTDEQAQGVILSAEQAAAEVSTLEGLRGHEAAGAAAYWAAWQGHASLRFARRDAPRVPPSWHGFPGRASALTGDPQHATGPINALLNLAYGLLLTETTIALRMVGLDPGLPLGLHAAQPNRRNAVLDILEPCRPIGDRLVLDLVDRHVFARRDFTERPNGTVRVSARIVRSLLEMMPEFAAAVAPVAEGVAQQLADAANLGSLPTPLTGRRRSEGRAPYRALAGSPRSRRNRDTGPALRPTSQPGLDHLPPPGCEECGTPIPPGRRRCSACHTVTNESMLEALRTETWRAIHSGELADSSHGGEAARRRGGAIRRRNKLRVAWERAGGDAYRDPERFQKDILPLLTGIPVRLIARETGLSVGYCAQIRAGRVPHPRHWRTLTSVGVEFSRSSGALVDVDQRSR